MVGRGITRTWRNGSSRRSISSVHFTSLRVRMRRFLNWSKLSCKSILPAAAFIAVIEACRLNDMYPLSVNMKLPVVRDCVISADFYGKVGEYATA